MIVPEDGFSPFLVVLIKLMYAQVFIFSDRLVLICYLMPLKRGAHLMTTSSLLVIQLGRYIGTKWML